MEKPKENPKKEPLCPAADLPAEVRETKVGVLAKENDKGETKKDDKSQKPGPEERSPLEELKRQKEEYLNGWKRERADFLNYKKDEMERIAGLIGYANEELILKFLPFLDNICLAEKELPGDLKENAWAKGVLNIKVQILDFLKNQGVEEIKCLGEKFDPNFQEIIEEVEAKDKESGIVIEEIQKGYTLYDKVIRPAKVKVVK